MDRMELLRVAALVAQRCGMRVRVKKNRHMGRNLAGGLSSGAVIGGILDGAEGLAIGGLIGALGAAAASHGKYKPAAEVITMMLPMIYQEELARMVSAVLAQQQPCGWFPATGDWVLSDPRLTMMVENQVRFFFESYLGMKVKYY